MPPKSKSLTKSSKKKPAYERILLKLSGESLQGPQGFGIDGQTIHEIAKELRDVHKLGVQNCHHGGRRKYFPRRAPEGF